MFYSHTGEVSGAEQMLLLTLRNLDRARFKPIVLCPPNGDLHTSCERLGVTCVPSELIQARVTMRPDKLISYVVELVKSSFLLRAQLAGLKPDLIHANSIRAGLVASTALLRTKVPVIWHIHDILRRHPTSLLIRIFAKIVQAWVIACSSAAALAFEGPVLLRDCSPSVSVIHNGIETSDRIESVTKSEARRTLGLNNAEFTVGIVGQITPRKGHYSLIQAFAKVCQLYPQLRLVIVGRPIFNADEEYLSRLTRLVAELKLKQQVKFLGSRADVPMIMKALDLLVLNSLVEPFALVILEAMLQGTPVLATDSGGPAEIIEHEKTGHLIPANDPVALEAALSQLANRNDLLSKYSQAGPSRVCSRFSSQEYMRRLEKFYLTLCPEKYRAAPQMPFNDRMFVSKL